MRFRYGLRPYALLRSGQICVAQKKGFAGASIGSLSATSRTRMTESDRPKLAIRRMRLRCGCNIQKKKSFAATITRHARVCSTHMGCGAPLSPRPVHSGPIGVELRRRNMDGDVDGGVGRRHEARLLPPAGVGHLALHGHAPGNDDSRAAAREVEPRLGRRWHRRFGRWWQRHAAWWRRCAAWW